MNALVAVPLYPIFSSKDQKNRTKIHSLVHSRVILILEKILNFTMGIPASCFILFTGFRTVFVFTLGTLRSSGGKFFGTLVDLEGEKRPKKAKFQNWLKTHPKLLNA